MPESIDRVLAGMIAWRLSDIVDNSSVAVMPKGWKKDMGVGAAERYLGQVGRDRVLRALGQKASDGRTVLNRCKQKDFVEMELCKRDGSFGRLTKRYGSASGIDELVVRVSEAHAAIADAIEVASGGRV